jgi:hypothetical protein
VDCFTKYLWNSIQPSKHAAPMADTLLDNFEQEKVIPQILQYDHEKEFMDKMAQVLKEQKPIIIQSVTMSNGIHV